MSSTTTVLTPWTAPKGLRSVDFGSAGLFVRFTLLSHGGWSEELRLLAVGSATEEWASREGAHSPWLPLLSLRGRRRDATFYWQILWSPSTAHRVSHSPPTGRGLLRRAAS